MSHTQRNLNELNFLAEDISRTTTEGRVPWHCCVAESNHPNCAVKIHLHDRIAPLAMRPYLWTELHFVSMQEADHWLENVALLVRGERVAPGHAGVRPHVALHVDTSHLQGKVAWNTVVPAETYQDVNYPWGRC